LGFGANEISFPFSGKEYFENSPIFLTKYPVHERLNFNFRHVDCLSFSRFDRF
jgi:hypothetical protein